MEIKMGFFLDSADRNEILAAAQLSYLTGVTTNPSLVAQAAGGPLGVEGYFAVLAELLPVVKGLFFVQVPEGDTGSMQRDALRLVALAPQRIVVKIPCTADGIETARNLSDAGHATAVTAVFSLAQAAIAASAGAAWVAPYCHRVTARGGDGIARARDMVKMLSESNRSTRVLAASIKSHAEVEQLLSSGIGDLTLPAPLLHTLLDHQLTAEALTSFRKTFAGEVSAE